MAKIVLTMDGAVPRELVLSKARTTIGRGPHNDLVIDSLAVSAEHATITLIGNDAILEDLNSTNGTQVNGQPIKKHFLQENDLIELAQFRITYISQFEPRLAIECESRLVAGARNSRWAAIRVLNGANAGKETPLTKVLTTIGRPGEQVAVIAQRSDGFYLNHVEGDNCVLINGASIAMQGHRLSQGDIIGLVGTQIEFLSD